MLEVNNVDLVARTKNVLIHFGVPVTCLVPKVCACLYQFAHVYLRHSLILFGFILRTSSPTNQRKPAPGKLLSMHVCH